MKRSARSAARARGAVRAGRARKTFFELPPLELECMKAVWALDDASVRQIREHLAARRRPLAYTTVETIMDRLTRKGAVERRKVGKAHRYSPVYQKSDARAQAVAALVEHFFDGSRRALRAYLDGAHVAEPRRLVQAAPPAPQATARRPAREAAPRAGKVEPPLDTTLL